MPTGYTAGILDGSIKDFKGFATLCMRNFGATIHLRDEPFSSAYEPMKPGSYHTKEIEKAKQLLSDAEMLPNDEIIARKVTELKQRQKQYKQSIRETKASRERLEAFLLEAIQYQPPTPEHEGIKKFMIKQLTETINFDGETDYYEKELEKITEEMLSITSDKIRGEMKEQAYKDLHYHTAELNKEIKRCEESNKWVSDFLKSLNGKTAPTT
jgi:cobalamin-dependent methionine synthase I